jgi:hypothetical protein
MTLVDIDAEPRFAHLLDMRVEFDPAQIFGTPVGTRMTFVINRGAGELIRRDEVYARSSPLFDTDDERFRWINAVHTVALNQMSLSEVHYKVFEVL